jgi:hypothetical protein
MAYAVPFVWSHGDYPTAARLNLYKSGLDAIHDALGDYAVNGAVARLITPVQGYYFLHRHRWLLYRAAPDAGRIEDPSGVGESVTLSATGSEWGNYDLSTIEWMIPGKLYQVQDVVGCMEDYEAL